MKVTILGCGSSGGVPLIGETWGDCDPKDPRNRRLRASILVEEGNTKLVVDTSPDFRQQALHVGLTRLDAVLYTHSHADHTHGIDELRSFNWLMKEEVDIYADPKTLAELTTRFAYIFGVTKEVTYYKPSVRANIINGAFSIGEISVKPFNQDHVTTESLGFRFGNFAYSTDVHHLSDAAFDALRGIDIWVVDCVRREPHPTHSHLAQTLKWIERVRPKQAYLTHLNHSMDYQKLAAELPPHVAPSYDGLVIEC